MPGTIFSIIIKYNKLPIPKLSESSQATENAILLLSCLGNVVPVQSPFRCVGERGAYCGSGFYSLPLKLFLNSKDFDDFSGISNR